MTENNKDNKENNIYDINKIKNLEYAKDCINRFLNVQKKNKIIQKKTAKELNIIGLCYRTLENYDEAIKYFDKAIQTDKNYKAPYFNKGTVYYWKEDYKNAEKYFLLGLEKIENDFLCLLYLGYCYINIKNYDKAIEYLDKAINVMPEDYDNKSQIYIKIAEAYYKINNIKEAVRNTLIGFQYSKNNLNFITYIYEIYDYNKLYKKAILYNSYLLNQDPNNYEYIFNRAELLYMLNRNEEAKQLFKKLSERNSEDYKNYIYLARIYKEENNFELAETYFLKTDEILKNDIKICIEIGNFYDKYNKKNEASKFYQKAIIVDPENIDTYQEVLPFAFDNAVYAKVFENIIDIQIAKNNANIYDFYTYKAGLLTARKLYEEALHILIFAIKNSPKKIRAYQIAEVLYKELNNNKKAEEMASIINKLNVRR